MQTYNMRVGANAVIINDGSILLIAFEDEDAGFHYNLPGGGVEVNETIPEALTREVREETCAEIEVGRLVLVTEYEPTRNTERYGTLHKLVLFFDCRLKENPIARLPDNPDPHQIGVYWIPLKDLPNVPLLPEVASQLLTSYRQNCDSETYLSL